MSKKKIGIIRGGVTNHYEDSLLGGQVFLTGLRLDDSFSAVDVLVDKNGNFYINGERINPEMLPVHIDVAFSHVKDPLPDIGHIDTVLRAFGIPFINVHRHERHGYISDRDKTKLEEIGVKLPRRTKPSVYHSSSSEIAKEAHRLSPPPYHVDIFHSHGAHKQNVTVNTLDEIHDMYKNQTEGIVSVVSEYIPGEEYVAAVLPGFRNVNLYVTAPIFVTIHPKPFSKNKDVAGREYIDTKLRSEIELYTRLIAGNLKINHPTLIHFKKSEKSDIYVTKIENNLVPFSGSLFLRALESNTISLDEYVRYLINHHF